MKLNRRLSTPVTVGVLSLFLGLAGCSTGHSGGGHDDKDGHHGDEKSEAHGHGDGAEDHHDSGAGKPGNPENITRTVMVDMNDMMEFIPASIDVKAGETIRFEVKNSGKIVHEFVIGSTDEIMEHHELMKKFPGMEHDEPNSVSLKSEGTGDVIWQFTNAGTFDFACLQPGHFEAGMKGKFNVAEK